MLSPMLKSFQHTSRTSRLVLSVRPLSASPLHRPAPPPLPPKEQRAAEAKGNELHPDARCPPPPDFEGDTNPVTGEVNGPKRDPVRHGDWSFGGRASDF
ncbi:hypothetical protein EW145_g6714 [Phellinidium pouzarii]|uniref:Succinate dehydrogenase assembly factor 4, mitochondrial n=1 Tax=Phellinidium pouzarii TaxID=167371 RepID=A0A4S4KVA4_9AGAM|nr:hypothetical protein EW145_g6714 [Phellinidium pouzarii]